MKTFTRERARSWLRGRWMLREGCLSLLRLRVLPHAEGQASARIANSSCWTDGNQSPLPLAAIPLNLPPQKDLGIVLSVPVTTGALPAFLWLLLLLFRFASLRSSSAVSSLLWWLKYGYCTDRGWPSRSGFRQGVYNPSPKRNKHVMEYWLNSYPFSILYTSLHLCAASSTCECCVGEHIQAIRNSNSQVTY